MPPLGTQYSQQVNKTGSYGIAVSDDEIVFTIAAPATATLPLAKDCSLYSGQNRKLIVNDATSSATLTIAVQSGNTAVGATAPGALTLAAGETAFVTGNGISVWNITGGTGVSGTSGISGALGTSGFSGGSGRSGFTGGSGFSGVFGFSGVSGFAGTSGFLGVSGFTGASGASGASGQSGFSGASGVAFP